MRIAIVGFGIADASTLIQLSKRFDLNAATDQVDVYETRPRLGAGAPYAEDDDNNEDFINWTKVNYPAIDIDNVFAPRTIYGEYVEAYLKPCLAKDYVRHIQAKVTDFQVVDADGTPLYQRPFEDGLAYQVF